MEKARVAPSEVEDFADARPGVGVFVNPFAVELVHSFGTPHSLHRGQ